MTMLYSPKETLQLDQLKPLSASVIIVGPSPNLMVAKKEKII